MIIEPFFQMKKYLSSFSSPEETPLSCMQQLCKGLQTGLNLIAARPRMGVSTFALSMAMHMVKEGSSVVYCAHRQQNIPSIVDRYQKSESSPGTLNDILFFYAEMCYPRTFEDFRSTMSNCMSEKKIRYIFVDCLQDFEVDERFCVNQSPEEYLCKNLRQLSYDLGVPIIALTHLNRRPEYRSGIDGKLPQLGDLRGGDLALYANQIYLPYRPAYYHIYYDAKTGDDIRDQMFIYAFGGIDGLNDEFRLTFDHVGGRVTDGFNIGDSSLVSKLSKEKHYLDGGTAF